MEEWAKPYCNIVMLPKMTPDSTDFEHASVMYLAEAMHAWASLETFGFVVAAGEQIPELDR